MGYLGIYRALYDHSPQTQASDNDDDAELMITKGDLLYIIEKDPEANWWKARKRVLGTDEDEPEGLVPKNYVEEASPISHARALYEYTRQTEEELSFPDGATIDVFDSSDQDWTLVGFNGEFGFVPANYIELLPSSDLAHEVDNEEPSPPLPKRPTITGQSGQNDNKPLTPNIPSYTEDPAPQTETPTITLATVLQQSSQKRPLMSPADRRTQTNDIRHSSRERTPDSQNERLHVKLDPKSVPIEPGERSPGGFHLYSLNEMVSVLGKKKKMPTTLGINLATNSILIAPEKSQDGPSQEWSADRMTHYSREGKHVFLELVQPSKSIDFHAGAKDTAEEIVNALSELASVLRAEGVTQSIITGGQVRKKGVILYDFVAQSDDEVTVKTGDEVIVLDDIKSEDWWSIRCLRNDHEGVVPASYIEITGTTTPVPSSHPSKSSKSTVEQNRRDEIRLTRQAMNSRPDEVQQQQPRKPRDQGSSPSHSSSQARPSRSKPDTTKIRTWTDRSKSYSVEAQFLGVKDGKINLHKLNGVKIAVPMATMSLEDLDFIERHGGPALPKEKKSKSVQFKATSPTESSGATIEQPRRPEYDWFQFFLSCDVAVGLCERYAQAFVRDSMDESVLPDVDAGVLRTLGLREGDIIKVMRNLDVKYGRAGNKTRQTESVDNGGSGGLFSGPGGTLRNNTKKSRPPPATQVNPVVDAKTLHSGDSEDDKYREKDTTTSQDHIPDSHLDHSFDDNAWDVKPVKMAPSGPQNKTKASGSVPTKISESFKDLSVLDTPSNTRQSPDIQASHPAQGFAGPSENHGDHLTTLNPDQVISHAPLTPVATYPRQRPAPPQNPTSQTSSLLPAPPTRPLSAPQSAQPGPFQPPPVMPQITGINPSSFSAQVAPPGQSMNDIARMHLQQQQLSLQPSLPQMHQMTGYGFQQPVSQHISQGPSPFAANAMATSLPVMVNNFPIGHTNPQLPLQAQPTGFANTYSTGTSIPASLSGGSVNSLLQPAMEPSRPASLTYQPTGIQQSSFGGLAPLSMMPLQPQKTGPPPDVRFGVNQEPKYLLPQNTGRKANLAQATPQNPFGF